MSNANWEFDLVEKLTDLSAADNPNRASLAHLRRGLDGRLDYTLARVGWLFQRVPDWALVHAALAAGLYAWAKGDCPHVEKVNFGEAFGAELTQEKKQQREKRFVDLLNTDAEDLSYKLRQAIALIAGNNVGLDWVILIRHLGQWNHADRWVQKEWARKFWAVAEVEANPNPDQTVTQ